jgi:transposase-like protein
MVNHANRKELAADLRGILAAPDRRSALKLSSSVANKWRQKGHEKVAEHVEEHIEDSLSCLAFPSLTAGASAPPTAWRGSTKR